MPRYVRPKWRRVEGKSVRPLVHDEHSVDDMLDLKPGQKRRVRRRMRDTLSDDVWLADECPCVECDNTSMLRVDYLSDHLLPTPDPLSVDTTSVDTPSADVPSDTAHDTPSEQEGSI